MRSGEGCADATETTGGTAMGPCGAGHALPDIPYFDELVGHAPYPWQRRFYGALLRAEVGGGVEVDRHRLAPEAPVTA